LLEIVGNYTQTGTGNLEIEIGGASTGQFDVLVVHSTANLAGELELALINGFLPAAANSFVIVNATNLVGAFANVAHGQRLETAGGEGSFVVSYNPATDNVILSSFLANLAGDYNGNGIVDAADYVIWRKNDGTPLGYNTWRTNFGRTLGSGSGALSQTAVPEPAATSLLLLAILSVLATGLRSSSVGFLRRR
jgi:hypothetical protein